MPSSASNRFFVISPPAASRMPSTSLMITEQRRSPPQALSKRIQAAREPLPSSPDIHARSGRAGRRPRTGRPSGAGTGTPAWERR
ncbi:MAG: hypothetical protein DME17_12765 [Candidatus Rokuibacteriota bacterium]|nr:MAG: hypothetical protein DME17_12765 [Candidatus Rokubacteria bacterium]